MSQYPQGSPPQPQHPGAYPPPPPGYGAPMGAGGYSPDQGGNGSAVASLVFGLLLCIPFVTGLLAILFGFMGRGRANQLGGKGRGMATAGLVLGLVGLVGWAASSPFVYQFYLGAKEHKELATQFVQAMSAGNVDKAASLSHSTMSRENLAGPSAKLQTLGKLTDVTVSGIQGQASASSGKQWTVTGRAAFESRTFDFTVIFVDEKGAPKVVEYSFK